MVIALRSRVLVRSQASILMALAIATFETDLYHLRGVALYVRPHRRSKLGGAQRRVQLYYPQYVVGDTNILRLNVESAVQDLRYEPDRSK